jgi:hypothetical protein
MLFSELACTESILNLEKVGTKTLLDLFNDYAI